MTTTKTSQTTTANPPQSDQPELTKAFCCNPQSKGGMGKSFVLEPITSWLDHYSVGWAGYDLDERHRTFSVRHPSEVKRFELGNSAESKNTFVNMLREMLRSPMPMQLLDMPAQADAQLVNAFSTLGFFDLCRKEGVMVTFFLFCTDDVQSMTNFRSLVQFGGRAVNYVVVKNPVKTDSKLFTGSSLERTLLNAGAKIIELPTVSRATMRAMERAEAKESRGISFAEFASPAKNHMEPVMMAEVQWALANMYEQLDTIANLLLPPALAAKVFTNTIIKSPTKNSKPIDEDGFGFNFADSE